MSPPPPKIFVADQGPEEVSLTRNDYSYASTFAGSKETLVIDNGASEIRVGWASDSAPLLICDNIVTKYRERKAQRQILLAGSEVYADATSKANLKTPFDGDVLCSSDAMENMLDFVFDKLQITGDSIAHPIAMTETLCNPAHSRGLMSELLFECYQVPSVVYSTDSLSSLYYSGRNQDALLISSSTASTTIIPVLSGRGILAHSRRIAWGGNTAAEFMLKLVQLKFPAFPTRVTTSQADTIVREVCHFSLDYQADLRSLADPQMIAATDRIIQFPFVRPVVEEKSAEELARQAERKKEAGRRLQEQQARMRLEKLVQKEQDLATFIALKASKAKERKADFMRGLSAEGFDSEAALDAAIAKTEKQLQRARNKELGIEEPEDKDTPSFPLVDVPDHQLNEEQLKEKRKQRLMKAGVDARLRAKAEKEAERTRQEEEARRDEEARLADPQAWLDGIRQKHANMLERMEERKKQKAALGDRKSLAAQQRMKSIATLASDMPATKKRRKKGDDDRFGADDNDWAVYRTITGADDSEEEEDEQAQLEAVETRLLECDPNFTIADTAAGLALRRRHLLNAFIYGVGPNEDPPDFSEDVEAASQLHVNVERVRVCEALYQPHMAGIDQAGLLEVIDGILRSFTPAERDRLTANVFVTGGHSLLPNFDARLRGSLQSILPVGAPLNIRRAGDVRLDTWRGLAAWSGTAEARNASITRAEYAEWGVDYAKEHSLMPQGSF